MSSSRESAVPPEVCAICQSPVSPGDATAECPACRARYHDDCWQENGGCAVYGCPQVPPTEARDSLETPFSYWGQEEKPCPVCARTIQAAAVRCRHCGASFSSARPETASEFRQRNELRNQEGRLRTTSIWLFVFSVLPCTAPLAAVAGACWWLAHRREIKQMPAIYRGLCLLGIALASVQTALMVACAFLYSTTRL